MVLESTVGSVTKILDDWFPSRIVASWDNTGLLVGSKKSRVRKILVCLTVTMEVCAEATEWGADLVISHHPLMFKPIQRLTDDTLEGTILGKLLRHHVAIYSPHTAHDGCLGGINDQLANLLELIETKPLFPAPSRRTVKLVTFVPVSHLVKVSHALFAAGGGVIGNYSGCSFQTEGTGTFWGAEGTNPVIGSAGKAESVSEIRLEVIFPSSEIPEAISRLKSVHPYEEPAYDLYPLDSRPADDGDGRIGHLETPTTLKLISQKLASVVPVEMIQVVGSISHQVKTIAIGCGAAGEWIRAARNQGADLFVTGEMRYHDMLWSHQSNMGAVIVGHYASESFAMKHLVSRLQCGFPGLSIKHATQDHFTSHWFGKSEIFTAVG